jgi:WD40 repeat protein
MNNLNENIIKIILSNYKVYEHKNIQNHSFNSFVLKITISYTPIETILKSIGRGNIILKNAKNVTAIALLRDGNIVTASLDKTFKFWDMTNYTCIKSIESIDIYIKCILTLSDNLIISASLTGHIRLWEIKNEYQLFKTLSICYGPVFCLLLLSNNKILCSSDITNGMTVFDYDNENNYLHLANNHTQEVYYVAKVSSKLFASGSQDTTIKLWDIGNDYVCLKTLTGHTDGVLSLTSAGDNLISGSSDKSIKVWDLNSYLCIRTIQENVNCILSLTKGFFVTGCKDNTLKIWHIKTGKCINVLNTLDKKQSGITTILLLNNYRILSAPSYAHRIKIMVLLSKVMFEAKCFLIS